jgi:hypothetical protein
VYLPSGGARLSGVRDCLQLRPTTLPELKKVAASPAGGRKEWLKEFLAKCASTPEKREIQALLSNPASKGK